MGLSDVDRLSVVRKIDELNDKHCRSCPTRPSLDPKLQRQRSQHCINECQIGKELQALGQQLNDNVRERKGMNVVVKMQKITKDEYLVLRASGNTRKEIAKLKGYPLSHLENYWLKKWGIKDQTVEEIELTAFAKQTPVEPPKTPAIEPETGDCLPEAQEPAIAPEVKSTDNEVAARIIAAEVELTREKDATIERLQHDLATWKEIYDKTIQRNNDANVKISEHLSAIRQQETDIERLVGERDAAHLELENNNTAIKVLKGECQLLYDERESLQTQLDAIKAPAQVAAAAASTDPVNHPERYIAGGIECLDAIEAATVGLSGGQAYTTGTAIEYLWQWSRYGGVEDLHNARWYLDRLIGGLDNATKPTGT